MLLREPVPSAEPHLDLFIKLEVRLSSIIFTLCKLILVVLSDTLSLLELLKLLELLEFLEFLDWGQGKINSFLN